MHKDNLREMLHALHYQYYPIIDIFALQYQLELVRSPSLPTTEEDWVTVLYDIMPCRQMIARMRGYQLLS